ncbi:hypothetical protein [Pseudazoarcus pumilus]|uniref:Uncharacterized protein n=1 Tax=Pseudazoarcus pumilus TaxID=2067960 RepID=A0A2I6S855_9RHOO|nr:hypothetical protein [Pseudazoarcus pumilus]AUN95444.1 hypothetical protein C0099_11195 [Pseudazoarcus pumilus]
MNRTALMKHINDLMTSKGCSLTEDQDAVLCAALGALWEEISGDAEIAGLRDQIKQWQQKAATWLASPEAAQRLSGYREMAQRIAELEAQIERAQEEQG